MELKTFQIDENLAGTRLDKAVCVLLECSRKRAADLIKEGRVCVNGEKAKASLSLVQGNEVVIDEPPLENLEVLPEEMDLDIVYEDQDVLVINKPRGLVVHPAPGHTTGTLVNGVLAHCKDLSGINGVMRPGIVHRIDKDTSGLIVICKNDEAHASISEQLSRKECAREYKAIVHHPFSHEYGTINAPIGRDEKDRQKMAVTKKNSKDAVTHFEVLENFKDYAYILCKLETGRTHQIRVHMQYIGHPLVGDPKYGYRKTLQTNGQLLHAYALEFTHPRTGERMRFTAEPDAIFLDVLDQLEKGVL
jgi:23S rRNA pseudouridine1911/1915/1917 synthase